MPQGGRIPGTSQPPSPDCPPNEVFSLSWDAPGSSWSCLACAVSSQWVWVSCTGLLHSRPAQVQTFVSARTLHLWENLLPSAPKGQSGTASSLCCFGDQMVSVEPGLREPSSSSQARTQTPRELTSARPGGRFMREVRDGRCLFPPVAHQVQVHLLEPLRRPCARVTLGCRDRSALASGRQVVG